jgi:hypothetical protein
MHLVQGWNTEFGRVKFDVLLDESDLARLLAEAGLPPEAASRMTTREVFQLLLVEGERFTMAAALMAGHVPEGSEKTPKERLGAAELKRKELLEGLTARLGK